MRAHTAPRIHCAHRGPPPRDLWPLLFKVDVITLSAQHTRTNYRFVCLFVCLFTEEYDGNSLHDSDSGLSSAPSSPLDSDVFSFSSDSAHTLQTCYEPYSIMESNADIMAVKFEKNESSLLEEALFMPTPDEPFTDADSLFYMEDPFLLAPELDTTDSSSKETPLKGLDQNSIPKSDCESEIQAKRRSTRLSLRNNVKVENKSPCHAYQNDHQYSKPVTQKRLPRSRRSKVSEEFKSEEYWERRRRNNLAAKRSREGKRARDIQVVQKTIVLEKENAELKNLLQKLKADIKRAEQKLRGPV